MNQDDVQQALTLLTEAFDFVVVDVPTHSFDGRLLGTLEAASKIVLVSTLDIGSVRDTRIYMELLKNLNVDQSKIKLCINRYDSSSGLMTVEEVEKTFNYHVSYYFPNDYLTAVNSACAGQAIMEYAPTSVLAQTYEELAANMNQEGGVDMIPKASSKDTKAKKKGGFLSKLIKT
jgi:pilus assembly protein CpaE